MVKEAKIKATEKLRKRIEEAQVIGMLDMYKLPSKQYQEIMKNIRDEVDVVMTKKSILLHALEGAKKENIKEIEKILPTQPALMFAKLEPFKFFMTATKMKSPTYAKAGDIAEDEIEVNKGPTDLMPGPVISEFSKAGIPAGVEDGKIAVKKDKVVAKKGDEISGDLANILRKLKIQPINVGLKIIGVYENGIIYKEEVLSLAGQGYIDQTVQASQHATNLTVSIGYVTKENIKLLLAKVFREHEAIASKVNLEQPSENTEEKKEEASEEKKEDTPAEEKTEAPKSEESKPEENQSGGN